MTRRFDHPPSADEIEVESTTPRWSGCPSRSQATFAAVVLQVEIWPHRNCSMSLGSTIPLDSPAFMRAPHRREERRRAEPLPDRIRLFRRAIR